MTLRKRYLIFRTFLFVGAALGTLAGVVLALQKTLGGPERVRYALEFREDISGLSASSPVTWEGKPIGKVEGAAAFAPGSDHPRVPIAVESTYAARFTTWTHFQLQANLVTGIQTIYVFRKDRGAETPAAPAEAPLAPGAVPFDQIDPSAGEQLRRDLAQAKEFAGKTLTKIDTEVTDVLKVVKEAIAKAEVQMEGAGKALEQTAKDSHEVLTKVGSILEEDRAALKATMENIRLFTDKDSPLNRTLDNLNRLTGPDGEVRRSLVELQGTLASVQVGLESVNRTLGSQEAGLSETSFQLRYAMVELRGLLETLNQDPSAVVWGKRRGAGGANEANGASGGGR